MAATTRLPRPIAAFWDWQRHAACRGMGDELFFYSDNERGSARHEREQRAKAVCHRCPVMVQCRVYALRVGEPYGVWGGLTENERDELGTFR